MAMPLDEIESQNLVQRLWPEWLAAREKSKEMQAWALGRQPLPTLPDTKHREFESLQEKAITPFLGLIVQSLAQALLVEGFRRTDDPDDQSLWGVWQANGMDNRQIPLYEAALTTGVAYMVVLPPDVPRSRRRDMESGIPEWRYYSSAKMTAFYEDPDDEWPVYAVSAEPSPSWRRQSRGDEPVWRIRLFDEENIYWFDQEGNRGAPVFVEARPHGFSVPPVIRYVNRQTIDGRAIGEIEPYIAAASRIDQDNFERLVVQRFGAWRVPWATGLDEPETDEDRKAEELPVRPGEMLISDSKETSFGSLPESQLEPHLRAVVSDIRMLASVSQTPPQAFSGDLVNISADALAAVNASYNRKITQRQQRFGEAHEQAFNLSARVMGIEVDESSQVQWRDMESRALAQTADAFGKLAQMLEIPVEVLWDKIGFLTEQDRTRAREIRSQQDIMGQLITEALASDTTGPATGESVSEDTAAPS